MKSIRKFLLAVLSASLLLNGCASSETAMSYGKTQISENVFRYWLSYYKNTFLNTYKDLTNTVESFQMVLENGQTAEEYLYAQTIENVKMTLICMELFRENELRLPETLEKQIDDYVDDILKEYAKENRKNSTDAENALWEALRNKQLGEKFRRQHVIGDFIADFISLSSKLVIEIDGDYHNEPEQKEADLLRTKFLNEIGFTVLRFTNEEVLGNTEDVINKINEKAVKLNDKRFFK